MVYKFVWLLYHKIFACVEFKVSVNIEEEYILIIIFISHF